MNTQMHIRQGYAPYDMGIKEDVFIKDVTGSPYIGQVSSPFSSQCTGLKTYL